MSQLIRNYSFPRSMTRQHQQDEESRPPQYNEVQRQVELNSLAPATTHHYQHHHCQQILEPSTISSPTVDGSRNPDRLYVPHQNYQNHFSSWSPKSPSSTRLSVSPALHSLPSEPRYDWMVRARELFVKLVVEWWLTEIVSWCFSAMCMAAIVGVLSFYDGRELPQWKLGITLNGFISVFSGFAKAALLLPTTEALGQLKW
jgi:hypothetical protein